VRYSPDETRMLTAGNEPVCAKEWDLATGKELVCLNSKMAMLRPGAIYGPDGKTAILGGGYEPNTTYDVEVWVKCPTAELGRSLPRPRTPGGELRDPRRRGLHAGRQMMLCRAHRAACFAYP